jgi:hypothetical protein
LPILLTGMKVHRYLHPKTGLVISGRLVQHGISAKKAFLNELTFIDNLRLRASYGLSGSSAIGINQYQALLGYDKSYANEGAVYPRQIGNSDLTWEKNKNMDVGVDYAHFRGPFKRFICMVQQKNVRFTSACSGVAYNGPRVDDDELWVEC